MIPNRTLPLAKLSHLMSESETTMSEQLADAFGPIDVPDDIASINDPSDCDHAFVAQCGSVRCLYCGREAK